MTVSISKKNLVPTKRAIITLINIQSRNALLRVLLVRIRGYIKSVLRYELLIFDTYHPDTLYLSKQGCWNVTEMSKGKGKGKSVPLQAWNGPEVSRTLRIPDFMTKAQDGGKVVSLTHRPPLPPGNAPGTHFC